MREKKLKELEAIASTIKELAYPGMSPKALINSVKERYPDATKKEIAGPLSSASSSQPTTIRNIPGGFTTSPWKRATASVVQRNLPAVRRKRHSPPPSAAPA
jgi:hypothetical protein